MAENVLYYGDNLDVLRRYIKDESVDLVMPETARRPYTRAKGEHRGLELNQATGKMNKCLILCSLLLTAGPVMAQQDVFPGWKFTNSKDEMTDERHPYISAYSAPTRNGRGRVIDGDLMFTCDSPDDRSVILLLDAYFGGNADDQVLVEYRFDSEPALAGIRWNLSGDNRAAYVPKKDVPGFTSQAKTSGRLKIRVTDPLDFEAITYTFNLRGFTAAYNRLEANCPK